jgi:hypothetical protein
MLPTMMLEILQVPGCPGADLLAARLDSLLAGRFPVTRRVVSTQADAERLGMTGSPAVLVYARGLRKGLRQRRGLGARARRGRLDVNRGEAWR